jgi:hypothetical protein
VYRNILSIIFIAVFLIVGCEKDEPGDPNYPTMIEGASEEVINEIATRLSGSALFNCTSIDTFGFCFITSSFESCEINDSVHKCPTLNVDDVVDLFTNAMSNYSDLLNLDNPSEIKAIEIKTTEGKSFADFKEEFPDSTPENILVFSNLQYYNGIQVSGTTIDALIHQGEVISVGGRRFNDIYLPQTDIYNEEKAKELLYNQTFTYNSTKIKPVKETYFYDSKKIIMPVLRDDKIELHLCWALYPSTWEIIVDSQTGEVISSVNIKSIR